MKPLVHILLVTAGLLAAGCGPGEPTPPPAGGREAAPAPEADHGHEHTDRLDLGRVRIGGSEIQVFQVIALVPGEEGDFDLDFAEGATLPGAVRGWIGDESGRGSRKARFEAETATRMHGHPEVPDPLAAEAMLWLEVEGVGKAGVALRR